MNADLLARAVDAAAKAHYEQHLSDRGSGTSWEDIGDWVHTTWRVTSEPAVRAVFGVIADHCDERRTLRTKAFDLKGRLVAHADTLRLLASELRETP